MYFHVVYEGGRRRYGGAGRNSQNEISKPSFWAFPCDGPYD